MDNEELLIAIKDMFERKVDEVKGEVSEAKSHMSVLVENLQGDIKAIAEGHSLLDRKIDNLQKDLTETKQELKQEIHSLKKDVAIVKDYVIGVDKKLNEHEVILKRVK